MCNYIFYSVVVSHGCKYGYVDEVTHSAASVISSIFCAGSGLCMVLQISKSFVRMKEISFLCISTFLG